MTQDQEPKIDDTQNRKSNIDISDDIEKDIDVHINNNTYSTITHNSNISINYYNIENGEETDKIDNSGRALKKYTVYLLDDYISKIDELKKQLDSDDTKLAQEAYELLLKQYRRT
ncbi:hypothetical protein RSJ21_09120 [Clostridium botulinum]|uniref:hypothetical protein n=1 Tax=Clostridium botulinum TaxID=1491 RepID=UPI000A175D8C|nr:hypothetical protein [Clostridium botulinum]AUM87760.1 hypothetical protein RSJ15_08630 [Clostridium botulinum]AUN11237.1 hypothetical protein RSJ6_12315 [Clostridium botulinum]AUN21617.1 hypothetical protein RSJ22_09240 [Clostridium botulinum]AUN25406.1 hypothetical protein RSJ21_09120 [Clostridium botulinum]NFO69929.1 hypothetical protein [Clostridium botulinum]